MHRAESLNNSYSNPFKRPSSNYLPQRPQTPINNAASSIAYERQATKINRSFSKLPTGERSSQPFYQRPTNIQSMSKSRVSVQSSASQLAFLNNDQGQIFPQDLLFLLKNQEKNINNFKDKIQRQKNRVQNDFAVLKTEIQHVLEDVKISVQAELDLVYKTFITKYAQLKGQVQELRQMRKQILMNNITTNKNFTKLNTSSNKDLLGEIQKDAEQFRNYKVYGYLSQLQKQKLSPILGLSNELILIGSADCPFYRNKQMGFKLKDVRQNFSEILTDIYSRIHDFVTTPEMIIAREKQEEQNNNMILKEMNIESHVNLNNYNGPQQVFDPHFPNNYSNISVPKQQGFKQEKRSSGSYGQQFQQGQALFEYVSPNQQCTVVKYGDSVNLHHQQRIVTDHNESILCIQFVNGRYIATGSKDKTINVYSLDGDKVATLKGHNSSICCLALIKNMNGEFLLASGSDHGCSALILWDTRSWNIQFKVVGHSAAVTAIVDLEDGRHLVTGSYDKKINLINHVKGNIVNSLNNNRTSVTSLIMSSDGSKLASSGLDNSLSIWNIVRKNNIVESILPQLSISNDSLICQLQPCIIKPEYVFAATRNGTLKIINIKTGSIEKSLMVNSNSIIELASIEREMKPEGPLLLSCSSKDNSLYLTKVDSGLSSILKLKYNTGIQFGCGIGPKVVFSSARGGIIAILNQSNTAREFSIYSVQIK